MVLLLPINKSDFNLCIARLENIHENLPESNYKADLLAILAQNRLKRANISQQTEFAVQFIEQLENYRDIKLFHLNEALQLKTKEIPTVLTAAALNDKCVRAIRNMATLRKNLPCSNIYCLVRCFLELNGDILPFNMGNSKSY